MHVLLHGHPTSAFATTLRMHDHCVDVAEVVEDLDLWVEQAAYAAVVLDPMTEDGAGAHWARHMRLAKFATPIVFATAAHVADATPFFRDADDVIRLPIGGQEFVARLQALVRRTRGHSSSVLELGDLSIDQETLQVHYRGTRLAIPKSPARMVESLLLRPGRCVTKEMFLADLYGGRDEPELKIIDVFICKLRHALRQAGAPADLIKTIWGRGYLIEARSSDATAKAA